VHLKERRQLQTLWQGCAVVFIASECRLMRVEVRFSGGEGGQVARDEISGGRAGVVGEGGIDARGVSLWRERKDWDGRTPGTGLTVDGG